MQQFLIIQTAFIGDVVMATALIEKLHAFFPGAQIDFLVRKGNEGLLKDRSLHKGANGQCVNSTGKNAPFGICAK